MRIWGGRGTSGVWLGLGGVWVQREGCIGGVSRCGWGRLGAAGVRLWLWLGVAWERLGVHWGSV